MNINYIGHIDISLDDMWNMITYERTPRRIFDWVVNNIDYSGFICLWKLQSPEELFINRAGNCHDQAVFMTSLLKFANIDVHSMLCVEFNQSSIYSGETHTVVYYTDTDGMIYWLETTWMDHIGIHGPYKNMSELKDDVVKLFDDGDDEFDGVSFAEDDASVIYPYGEKIREYIDAWDITDKIIYPSKMNILS